MVRKLYSFMMGTLDGFYEGPNQEFDWPNVDERVQPSSRPASSTTPTSCCSGG